MPSKAQPKPAFPSKKSPALPIGAKEFKKGGGMLGQMYRRKGGRGS